MTLTLFINIRIFFIKQGKKESISIDYFNDILSVPGEI